jgi:glycine betaine/proline transport system substrate-binding protein
MKNRHYVKALISLLLFSSMLGSTPFPLSEKVGIPINHWSSQRVLSNVVGQLIESLGTPVEYVNISADRQWGALKRGLVHFQIEVWEPSMGQEFNTLVANGDIIDLGTHAATVTEDWWYPKYVEYSCPKLPQWQALNQCKSLFKGRTTIDKGVYFGGPWNYGDADIIRALGLKFTIERLPDELALWETLTNAITTKKPIMLLNWSPNWTDNYVEGKFVDFPLYTDACEKDPGWGLNKNLVKDCGNRRGGWLKKAASLNLQKEFPCVYNLIKNISFTNQMISEASSLAVIEKLSDQDAAIEWSKIYAKDIEKWQSLECPLPKAN